MLSKSRGWKAAERRVVAALGIERDRPPVELAFGADQSVTNAGEVEEVRRIAGTAEDADQATAGIAPVGMAADQVAVR